MSGLKRLSPEVRKAEIMEAGAKIFIKKGFSNTTMEDVIYETTMSKGGVYHYYKSTVDILKDLMIGGIQYRKNVIESHIKEYQKSEEAEFFAKRLVEKMIDDNPYMPIYVQFLIEKKRNPELNDLFDDLKEKTKRELQMMVEGEVFSMESFELATDFLNAIILGSDVLDARENFVKNQTLLEKMVILILKNGKE